ncbi:Tim44 domain-containing protein [Undibacterium parvum]|uniref:Tim44 domain-containing protein n=1 Tax=Undibacterium parvum TaxID=401471 RepID=A0A3Q9BRC9_9BURK|nr:Tim44-like domain-containing protein [Undibacterium parvum]AZP12759.1 Tim44 domain-containing protein [Undibacterium parvum]
MKKFLFAMMLMAGALSMTIADAEAKRMGGGGSAGRQSSNVSRQAAPAAPSQAKPAAAPNAAPGATPPKPASPWKGIVGGLIGGALLGAMFSHLGLGAGLASALGSILPMLLLAGAAFFLYRMYQNRKGGGAAPSAFSQPSYAGASSTALPEIGSRIEPQSFQSNSSSFGSAAAGSAADQGTWSIPADFDVPGFLRNAKTYFIRLQAAWDKADINDIREFTTAEMFAEIKLQIQERGATANVTDVVTVDAELLGLETVGNEYLASVKFSGMIKEDANAPAEAFKEVWNLTKPLNGQGGWTLAGIQQL